MENLKEKENALIKADVKINELRKYAKGLAKDALWIVGELTDWKETEVCLWRCVLRTDNMDVCDVLKVYADLDPRRGCCGIRLYVRNTKSGECRWYWVEETYETALNVAERISSHKFADMASHALDKIMTKTVNLLER